MSQSTTPRETPDDPWQQLADNREVLETIVDEEYPFAPYAENLLESLDERGYE